VPLATVYASVAGVLLACLLTFLIGYRLGHGRGEAIADRLRPVEVVPLVDPLVEDSEAAAGPGGVARDPEIGDNDGAPRGPASGGDSNRPAGGGSGAVLTASGVAADPRLDGHNYLELAVLTRLQAEAAVAFLAENGVSAIGVPADGVVVGGAVDRGGRGSNNVGPASRFRVVAVSLAVPSGRYSAMGAERRSFEQRLGEIGRRWVSSGGASDFRAPLWRRYER